MEKTGVRIMIRTIFITYVLTAVFLVVLALCLYRFHLGEDQVNMGVNAIYILVCLLGGVIAGKMAKRKRFIWGLLTGIIYFLILFGVSFLMHRGIGSSVKELSLIFAMCVGSGTVGGMVS